MSGEVFTGNDPWESLEPGLQEAWEDRAVEAAASNQLVQDMLVQAAFYGGSQRARSESIRESIERLMDRHYSVVPLSRRGEVYVRAAEIMNEEQYGTA